MSAWEQTKAIEQYAGEAEIVIPERQEMLSIISCLATEATSDSPTVVDLGCGFGDVTAAILAQRPRANVRMLDFSEEMGKLRRARFKGNPAIKIFTYDLNRGLPDSLMREKIDTVVSCSVIHYLEPENRQRLYADILRLLPQGAAFLNGDLFCCDSPLVDRWEFDRRIRWMLPRMEKGLGRKISFEELKKERLDYRRRMGEKPGTIWQMHDDLKKAGFRHVDCLWKSQCFGIMAAIK